MKLQNGVLLSSLKWGLFTALSPAKCSVWVGRKLCRRPRATGRGIELSQAPSMPHPAQADDPCGLSFLEKSRKGLNCKAPPSSDTG